MLFFESVCEAFLLWPSSYAYAFISRLFETFAIYYVGVFKKSGVCFLNLRIVEAVWAATRFLKVKAKYFLHRFYIRVIIIIAS
jgi:hypothetical protein